MCQVDPPLCYLWFYHIMHHLSLARRNRRSVNTRCSLKLTFYKYRRPDPRMYPPLNMTGIPYLQILHVHHFAPL